MINNHNNDRRLGGPNADAIERIKALTRPKMVQAPKLPDMYPVHDIPPKHLYEPDSTRVYRLTPLLLWTSSESVKK